MFSKDHKLNEKTADTIDTAFDNQDYFCMPEDLSGSDIMAGIGMLTLLEEPDDMTEDRSSAYNDDASQRLHAEELSSAQTKTGSPEDGYDLESYL
ncbi:hypothetical protein ISF_01700 [Cordyceps fumosorosea ARSEF 2679]|uniref:Uncharacterized protein n=1 Tax=Cordyceps fumosorosea (strain ARSEF 2679) TaxID=1081104 RepID=A0A162MVE9_CORFA|nr:hypothetical protein ISF_01700 [Cordyceps fumosorosea ARSEF 2679]OAA71149.1 hypothetical protein ISF_01700 [Cordyceps fumosorosea ARSEF 2679]